MPADWRGPVFCGTEPLFLLLLPGFDAILLRKYGYGGVWIDQGELSETAGRADWQIGR